jgi:predicted amidophosphoribosyltransferase
MTTYGFIMKNNKHICKDCGNKLKYHYAIRCQSCYGKWRSNYLKNPKNHPMFGKKFTRKEKLLKRKFLFDKHVLIDLYINQLIYILIK